ncbi:hypothetical protein pb186bvf_005074 [Paramecium bursaria]
MLDFLKNNQRIINQYNIRTHILKISNIIQNEKQYKAFKNLIKYLSRFEIQISQLDLRKNLKEFIQNPY